MDNIQDTTATTTEFRILEAAKKVFIQQGLEGTSMQQIADEAGINKSLLHYYFRSKEKLFGEVFSYAFQYFVPQLKDIMTSNNTIIVKIEKLVSEYMDLLMRHEFIPAFVLHEINRDPERIFQIMQSSGVRPSLFLNQFQEEMDKGHIRAIDPKQLIINILSMCIFPIAAKPLIQRLFFENKDHAYQQFLEERKKAVADFIIESIRK
jgi:TetR/AcrR family transcriptional regulator